MTLDGPLAGVPGARVREVEKLPARLEGGVRIGPGVEATPGALLLSIPRIARFLVRDGETIDVEIAPLADRDAVRLFVEGSARGGLIHQRGELALEATTLVTREGAAVAICGHSGVGKSTVGAMLARAGWKLLADGVTRVTWNGAEALAWPSHDAVKLWRNACNELGIAVDDLQRVRRKLEKFYAPLPAATAPAPLTAIIRLRTESASVAQLVPAADVLDTLSQNTFRFLQLAPLGRQDDHARIVSQIAAACRILTLDGTRKLPIAQTVRAIEDVAQ